MTGENKLSKERWRGKEQGGGGSGARQGREGLTGGRGIKAGEKTWSRVRQGEGE